MIIVGERLNSSREVVLEALQKKDADYLSYIREQAKKSGA